MPDMPNRGQVLLLLLGVGVFVVGGIVSLFRLRDEGNERLRLAAKICLYVGVCISLVVLIWHSVNRRSWMPLEDNFDTLIWLGLFLALFVAYVQRVHPLRGLDWFIMPIVILLLTAAAFFGRAKPHEYLDTSWSWLHRVTAFGGAVAFAVGGAAGAMYLIASRQLRAKTYPKGHRLGSLERLEHITVIAVRLGFALLTVGLITGLVRVARPGNRLGQDWYTQPKVLLTFIAWLIYALVLHSPINPSFRGRKTAVLSVVGLFLMIGVLIAVQLMPSTK
jgi:ABC-type transport system involved in cytochrome c biogenesis permease subunit